MKGIPHRRRPGAAVALSARIVIRREPLGRFPLAPVKLPAVRQGIRHLLRRRRLRVLEPPPRVRVTRDKDDPTWGEQALIPGQGDRLHVPLVCL